MSSYPSRILIQGRALQGSSHLEPTDQAHFFFSFSKSCFCQASARLCRRIRRFCLGIFRLECNHMDMTKFASVDGPGFQAVCGVSSVD
ncbi:hypothetical protein B0I35DRAFT_95567 [Stachybotrys elegans]|uniref:Uncharacterized protein n=1 Tax=Stachybotrys elegans TaxID=80388 RepID=A0A8K0SI59_9HYPO|nr:hypothetical protein B0I35DRAFT_95567 [Stachybotrys elegans]